MVFSGRYVTEKKDNLISPSRHPYRKNWGKDEAECRRNYRSYIISREDDHERGIFSDMKSVLGDEAFKSGLKLVSEGLLLAKEEDQVKCKNKHLNTL